MMPNSDLRGKIFYPNVTPISQGDFFTIHSTVGKQSLWDLGIICVHVTCNVTHKFACSNCTKFQKADIATLNFIIQNLTYIPPYAVQT